MASKIHVGMRLKYAREAAVLTQEELGRRLGVTRTYIGAIEAGSRNPTLDWLWRACEQIPGCNPHDVDPRLCPREPARRR